MSAPPSWVLAVFASAGVTLALRARRSPPTSALAAGILAASVLAASDVPRLSLALALGAALVLLGQSQRRITPARRWRLLEVTLALLTLAAGVRAHVSGVVLSDSVLTAVWVIVVLEGFRHLADDDDLISAVGALVGTGGFILGALARQPGVSAVSAGLVATCIATLALAPSRRSTVSGEAGAALVGLAAATLGIAIAPSVEAPGSFAVPVVLLAVPLVAAAGWRSGPRERVTAATTVGRRAWDRAAIRWLVPVTGATTVLSVLAGRGVIPALAVLALASALVVTGGVRSGLWSRPPSSERHWRTGQVLGLGFVGVATVVPAVVALTTARGPASRGVALARSALDAASTADAASTTAALSHARQLFGQAASRLRLPGASLGLAVPFLASNVDAARALVSLGEQLSSAGVELAGASERLRLRQGGLELTELRALEPLLTRAAAAASRSKERLRSVNRQVLAGPLRDAVEELGHRVDRDVHALRLTADATRHLPAILGGDRPRHYFLAFQSNGELRGTGGFIGNWGEIEADAGRLKLARFGQVRQLDVTGIQPRKVVTPPGFREQWGEFVAEQFWTTVNVSPDFPTTARLVTQLYPQSGGRPVDGVVAVDAPGLAALLELTGPVAVPGWPDPISSSNVVDVTLRSAAEHFPSDAERQVFLSEVVHHVVDAFTTRADGVSARSAVLALARAVAGRHLLVYLNDPGEQALVRAAKADGAVSPVRGDSLLVVNQNMAGNKTDLFLHRRIRYRAILRPVGRDVEVDGGLEVSLRNDAPASGLSEGLIGPYDPSRFAPGENRSHVALYTALSSSRTDAGGGLTAKVVRDLQRWVRSWTVSIPSRSVRDLSLRVSGRAEVGEDGWYRLDVLRQTLLNPDEAEVVVEVPAPWRIEEAHGVSTWDAHRAVLRRNLDGPTTVALRLDHDAVDSVWRRLWDPSLGWPPTEERPFPVPIVYGAVALVVITLRLKPSSLGRNAPRGPSASAEGVVAHGAGRGP